MAKETEGWENLEEYAAYARDLRRAVERAVPQLQTIAQRDAQAREEVAAALQGKNPPLAESYVFDPITLRVKIKQAQKKAIAAAVAAEREADLTLLREMMAEVFHTAFRKAGGDDRNAHNVWVSIRYMDEDVWGGILDWAWQCIANAIRARASGGEADNA